MKRTKSELYSVPHPAEITNLSHDGKGVARINGKVTFIQGALPKEQIEFQYTKIKKDFDEGVLTSLNLPSSLRVEPKCPHYILCGGCSLQHMNEKEQIQYKQEQLLDLLLRFGRTQPLKVLPPLIGPHWNYRNKARLSVRFVEKKQKSLVGFRERNNGRYITEITQCPILNAKVDANMLPLRQLIDSLEKKDVIAQIEVAAGDKEVALIFRNLTLLTPEDEWKLKQFAELHDFKIFLQPGGPESVYCLYPPKCYSPRLDNPSSAFQAPSPHVWGEGNKEEVTWEASDYLTYTLPLYQLTFHFHPTDFIQVNADLNKALVELALQLMDLKVTDSVLDLFCGLGNFSLPMSKFCSKVVGVEGSNTMAERASMNAKLNHIVNASFYAANLDDPKEVTQLKAQHFNKILIDPPRSGALELVKQMDLLNPERIVYVSCNPITLARDTEILVHQKGYVLMNAGVMDMFPHTTHVESIALFEKG